MLQETDTMSQSTIHIEETERTPGVVFDQAMGALTLSGESYPEDAGKFYGPVLQSLKAYLEDPSSRELSVDMRMIYFNSSSAKAVMNMFQMLEQAAENGKTISITWYHDPDDDTMEELGEDFAEDFQHAGFSLKAEAL